MAQFRYFREFFGAEWGGGGSSKHDQHALRAHYHRNYSICFTFSLKLLSIEDITFVFLLPFHTFDSVDGWDSALMWGMLCEWINKRSYETWFCHFQPSFLMQLLHALMRVDFYHFCTNYHPSSLCYSEGYGGNFKIFLQWNVIWEDSAISLKSRDRILQMLRSSLFSRKSTHDFCTKRNTILRGGRAQKYFTPQQVKLP